MHVGAESASRAALTATRNRENGLVPRLPSQLTPLRQAKGSWGDTRVSCRTGVWVWSGLSAV